MDYGEVYSPVAHNTKCYMLLFMANVCNFEIELIDVCQAFLNVPLKEDIYIYIYISIYMYVYMLCLCMYTCICIYMISSERNQKGCIYFTTYVC